MKEFHVMQISQIIHTVGLVLTISILNSCTDSSTNPVQNKANQIFPLALNNTWIYKYESFDTTGNITESWFDTVIVKRDTIIDNERWFALNSSTIWCTNRADGFYSYWSSPFMEYKYPAVVGDSILYKGNSLIRKVLSINDSISINNKLFVAYKYLETWPNALTDTSWNIYFAPNVGQIRVDMIINKPPTGKYVSRRTDLIYYKLN